MITPSMQAKAAGHNSLAALSRSVDVSVQTLINWHRNKPKLFNAVCRGAVIDNHTKPR